MTAKHLSTRFYRFLPKKACNGAPQFCSTDCADNWCTWTRKPSNSAVPVPVKSIDVQFILVLPRTEKIVKTRTYRVLDPGFTMHAWDASRESICVHACMSWPAISKELLAAKYSRVAPRCRTTWPLCWPQNAFFQQRSSCWLCKTAPAPEVPHLYQALLSRS